MSNYEIWSNNLSLKYHRLAACSHTNIGIRIKFVAKTQFLYRECKYKGIRKFEACNFMLFFQEVGHSAGPVNSGSSVHLICIAEGGKPSPILLWHRNNLLIDSSMEEKEGRVRNELIIPQVGEKEAKDSFSCSASNNNITQPLGKYQYLEKLYKYQNIKTKIPLSLLKQIKLFLWKFLMALKIKNKYVMWTLKGPSGDQSNRRLILFLTYNSTNVPT